MNARYDLDDPELTQRICAMWKEEEVLSTERGEPNELLQLCILKSTKITRT